MKILKIIILIITIISCNPEENNEQVTDTSETSQEIIYNGDNTNFDRLAPEWRNLLSSGRF